jgi:hypothetical protein
VQSWNNDAYTGNSKQTEMCHVSIHLSTYLIFYSSVAVKKPPGKTRIPLHAIYYVNCNKRERTDARLIMLYIFCERKARMFNFVLLSWERNGACRCQHCYCFRQTCGIVLQTNQRAFAGSEVATEAITDSTTSQDVTP